MTLRPHSKALIVVSHFLPRTTCLKSPLSVGNETVIGMTATLGYSRVSTAAKGLTHRRWCRQQSGIHHTRNVLSTKLS
jgi:hypothetical protein